eukprot:6239618-Prymnesium_polylepis.1
MDADALLMNMDVAVTSLLERYSGKAFLFGTEYSTCDRLGQVQWRLPGRINGTHPCDEQHYPACPAFRRINGGTFVVRNSARARGVLNRIYSQGRVAHPRGLGNQSDLASTDTHEWDRWRVRGGDEFCELAATLPQQSLNSMRKAYLPGDFVYHMAGGGLIGNSSERTGNPKYDYLTHVCHGVSPNATAAQKAAIQLELAILTDHFRRNLRMPWPPIAQAYIEAHRKSVLVDRGMLMRLKELAVPYDPTGNHRRNRWE